MTILNYRDSLFDFRIQYTNNTLAASQTGIRDTTYKQNNLTKLIEIIQLINEVWHFFHKTCSPALLCTPQNRPGLFQHPEDPSAKFRSINIHERIISRYTY